LAIQLSANEFKVFGRTVNKKWLVSVRKLFENQLTWLEVRKVDDDDSNNNNNNWRLRNKTN
jgi:hypothetical protein